jgi:hypothetical protein
LGDIKESAIHSSGLDRLTDGLSGAVVSVVQQRDQNQDRYWNSKQPKKNVTHFGPLLSTQWHTLVFSTANDRFPCAVSKLPPFNCRCAC